MTVMSVRVTWLLALIGCCLSSIDWRHYNDKNWLPWVRNQYAPNYCNASWIFATTTVLASVAMIQRDDVFPQISLSPQLLLDCADTVQLQGCNGGNVSAALQWISENGIVEDSCNPYTALDFTSSSRNCTNLSFCSNCFGFGESHYAFSRDEYPLLLIDEFGQISGETEMIQYLNQAPIICKSSLSGDSDTTYLAVVGYDSDDDSDYWIVTNSRGMFWRNDGYSRISRGSNAFDIESECYWATFTSSSIAELSVSWSDSDSVSDSVSDAQTDSSSITMIHPVSGVSFTMTPNQNIHRPDPKKKPKITLFADDSAEDDDDREKYTSLLPENIIADTQIPDSFGWYEVQLSDPDETLNFLTNVRQQHLPTYCGSCWAFSGTSAISDRINVLRYYNELLNFSSGSGSYSDALYPEINLSPQVLINVPGAGGNCDGGSAQGVLKYLYYTKGLPHETCQIYEAINDPHGTEHRFDICYTCDGKGNDTSGCRVIKDYDRYRINGYGTISSSSYTSAGMVRAMKKEIYARGPVACLMYADVDSFLYYTGGIYWTDEAVSGTDHLISIVGWGVENGTDYWVVRNSWSMGWGEDGYFRIVQGENMLNIEKGCYWGLPTYHDLNTDFESIDLLHVLSIRQQKEKQIGSSVPKTKEKAEEHKWKSAFSTFARFFGVHSLL